MSQPVFLSSVSSDFPGFRQLIAGDLRRTDAEVRDQEHFRNRGGLLLKLLDDYIRECRVVIHLVGAKAGHIAKPDEVADILDKYPDFVTQFPNVAPFVHELSYTQWEAWLALYHGRDPFVWVHQPEVAPGQPPFQREPSQQTHFELLQLRGHLWPSFSGVEQLRREILISLHDILPPRGNPRPCHLPYSTLGELFIGRETFLAELRQKFETARDAGRWPKQAVCGVGGLGKTQVAVEYALQYRDQYTAILMVNADTPESLRSGLAGLAGVLYSGLDPATNDDVKERATLDWLQKNPGWLLIVDNADDDTARNAVVERLSQWANGHVLITARFKQWPQTVEALDLHVLSVEDAVRFLLQATQDRRRVAADDGAQARLLADQDLDGLCLALEQAAAYIAERQITFEEYRKRWAENLKEARTWANKHVTQFHPDREISESVATTWLTTFQQLPPASKTLLQMLSWLAPDPIPQRLIDHPEMQRQLQNILGERSGVSPPREPLELGGLTPPRSPYSASPLPPGEGPGVRAEPPNDSLPPRRTDAHVRSARTWGSRLRRLTRHRTGPDPAPPLLPPRPPPRRPRRLRRTGPPRDPADHPRTAAA